MLVFSLWVETWNAVSELATIDFYGLLFTLPLMLPYFCGGCIPSLTYYVINLLSDVKLYALP